MKLGVKIILVKIILGVKIYYTFIYHFHHKHHITRRTLMSPQECNIARCTQNQFEMRTISLVLAPSPPRDRHHTEQVA